MSQEEANATGRLLGAGEIVGGHYQVESVLGEGGMAVVYRARNMATDKVCAVKVLHAQLGARSEFQTLFSKEAKVGTVVGESPFIVRVFDAGFDPARGLPFIVMEMLRGQTLQQAMNKGPLAWPQVVSVMDQLGQALEQAHAAGVVHRDLKPSNIFLEDHSGQFRVKVMDFGIAKVLADEAIRTATQIGTPAYTAPEQMGSTTRRLAERQGIRIARGVSAATDVWALGLIAYEMIVGVRPGQYWDVETMTELPLKIAFEPLDLASSRATEQNRALPPGFDAWFSRCLEKDAADRYPSVKLAIDELMLCISNEDGLDEVLQTRVHADAQRERHVPRTVASLPRGMQAGLGFTAPLPHVSTPPPLPLAGSPSRNEGQSPHDEQDSYKTGDGVVMTECASMPLSTCSGGSRDPQAGSSQRRKELSPKDSAWASWLLVATLFLGTMTALSRYQAPVAAGGGVNCESLPEGADASLAQCQHRCDSGSKEACAGLAKRYGKAKDDASSRKISQRYHLKACGVETDTAAAGWQQNVALSRCQAEQCIASSCIEAARLSQLNSSRSDQKGIATALLERVCKKGNGQGNTVDGCVALGHLQRRAGDTGAARDSFRRACEAGKAAGCVALGDEMLRTATASNDEDERAIRGLYKKACEQGELRGCNGLANFVASGRGGWTANPGEARRLRERACQGGVRDACVSLGVGYRDGIGGIDTNSLKAERLLRTACDGGNLRGCAELSGLLLAEVASRPDAAVQAYTLSKKACDGDNAMGCSQVARMIESELAGLRRSPKRQQALYEKACSLRAGKACNELVEHLKRTGRQPSSSWSAQQEKACQSGQAKRCFLLGQLRTTGTVLPKDLPKSVQAFERACGAGHARACTALANLHFDGNEGVVRDRAKSFRLNKLACDGGDVVGCSRLALLYGSGVGTMPDPAKAKSIYQRICAGSAASDLQPNAESGQRKRCSAIAALLAQKQESAP